MNGITYTELKKVFDSLPVIENIEVVESCLFPFDQSYLACDVQSRKEISVKGETVHGIELRLGQYSVSKELWEEIKKCFPQYAVEKLTLKFEEEPFAFFMDKQMQEYGERFLRHDRFTIKE